jgi:hypothetical protein
MKRLELFQPFDLGALNQASFGANRIWQQPHTPFDNCRLLYGCSPSKHDKSQRDERECKNFRHSFTPMVNAGRTGGNHFGG